MSQSPSKSSAPASGATSKWTASEVIEAFRDLGLPVCDDETAINEKAGRQKKRYLKEKNHTDPKIRARADKWFERLSLMQNKRDELLGVIYQHFRRQADLAVESALGSSQIKLNQGLVIKLEDLARAACACEDELASRFAREYVTGKGWREGEDVISSSPVAEFNARSGVDEIELSWRAPRGLWDQVEIYREQESPPKLGAPRIYQGRDSSFIDRGVEPGAWYVYRIHTVYQEVYKSHELIARGVCMREARGVDVTLARGLPRVSWEPLDPGATVIVFRSTGAEPTIRWGSRGPEPGQKTERAFAGAVGPFIDREVVEGQEYHYRVTSCFGEGLYTFGVDRQARVPKAPPVMAWARAAYRFDAERDVVSVQWSEAAADGPLEYMVIRREGSAPAGSVDAGEIVARTAGTTFLDEQVVSGRRYVYSVFGCTGDLTSKSGAATASVVIESEVTDLEALEGDGAIDLRWREPERVGRVLIKRGLNPPTDFRDGTPLYPTEANNVKDADLTNGQDYHYLVCCAYRPDGDDELITKGTRISASPRQPPTLATNFAVSAHKQRIECSWTPPEHGVVAVLRSGSGPPASFAVGQRLTVESMDRLGERLLCSRGRAVDPDPDYKKPYYLAFSISGSEALYVGAVSAALVPEVTNLSLAPTVNGVILVWTWPESCHTVVVARRGDQPPKSFDDPAATTKLVTRSKYNGAGQKYVDELQDDGGLLHYAVYAQAPGATRTFVSKGEHPECRASIEWTPWMTLRYWLKSPGNRLGKRAALKLRWEVDHPLRDFVGFALVAREDRPPRSLDDGMIIYRFMPKAWPAPGRQKVEVDLSALVDKRWSRCFIKAAPLDPRQARSIMLVHPNTGRAYDPATGARTSASREKEPLKYNLKRPKTVVCPTCFLEFPAKDVRFGSLDGNDLHPARTGIGARLRNGKQAGPSRKFCPQGHALPFTAGVQAGMVIGLIGAKYAGKSHYVAALIRRLQDQTGRDFDAALLPVTDETSTRFQNEFEGPLFDHHLEIEKTVGTRPPLIYDLTIGAGIWPDQQQRGVTLSLYDTAGENLDSESVAARTVEYLRVASGALLLIDPLQSEETRELLPASAPRPPLDEMADPNLIVARVLSMLERGRVMSDSPRLSLPLAVVLTKCDALRDAGLIEANRLWSTQLGHVGAFDRRLHADMNSMMGELTERLCPAAYRTISSRFSRHAFFGVSSTGCSSDPRTGRYKYVSPWRVEDPLLWLFSQLGVIPTR